MPRLLMFAPCDKVIISQEDNSPSLISILENININIPAFGPNFPRIANLPIRWHIFTLWSHVPEDARKLFQQRTQLVLPDGQSKIEQTIEFRMVASTQRNVVGMFGFPVLPPGQYPLRLSLRESGQIDGWNDVAEFPVSITHAG